jgi:hypothetical protein
MAMENFRPKGKPIEDKDLAHDMAQASDESRTKEAKERNIVTKKATVLRRIADFMAGKDLVESNKRKHDSTANYFAREAEWKEDEVEMENFARKELKGIAFEELERLSQQAWEDMEKAENEYMAFNRMFAKLDGPEQIKKVEEQNALERKKKAMTLRWSIIETELKLRGGQDFHTEHHKEK